MLEKIRKNKFLIIGLIAIVIIAIITIFLITRKVKFEIAEFSISKETTDYEYVDNTTYFDGEGKIITKDKKGIYLVVLRAKLISEGNEENENYDKTQLIIVSNGEGKFGTYDYGKANEIKKPKYEFKILGYSKLK